MPLRSFPIYAYNSFFISIVYLDIVACLLECQVDTNQIVACLWAVGAHCQHGAGIVGQTPGDGSILIAVGVGYRIQSRFFVVREKSTNAF